MLQSEHMDTDTDTLLLETLQQIWHNYVKAAEDVDSEVKQHWLQLFLFYCQYVDTGLSKHDKFISFFNLVPEEICSYLLEQVYEIISKSDLFATTQLLELNALEASIDEWDPDTKSTHKKRRSKVKLLRKKHNFAQLILSTPSDCNKIVALRTFLTHKLGHHLLQFLLNVDIQLIASQKTLCSLCINLFPNCPWGDNHAELQKKPTIFAYIGNLSFYQQPKKQKNNFNVNKNRSQSQPPENISTISAFPVLGQDLPLDLTQFSQISKTSDEIALLLIQLLSKCVANECETTLTEQSMSVVALNFALDALRMSNDAFGSERNAEVIKLELLHLSEQCLNNLFVNAEHLNEIQFQYIFTKLAVALECNSNSNNCTVNSRNSNSNDSDSSSLSCANISGSVETAVSCGIGCSSSGSSAQVLYGLIFTIFGLLHNVVAVYNSGNPNIRHLSDTLQLCDESLVTSCVQLLKQLTLCPMPEVIVNNSELQKLFGSIFKTFFKIIDHLCVYEQHLQQHNSNSVGSGNGLSASGSSNTGQKPPPRRRNRVTRQIHCRQLKNQMSSCFFQGILLNLLPHLNTDLQEYTVRYLLRAGVCCCHYTLQTYSTCLQVAIGIGVQFQKCAYKFLYVKFLHAIFVRECNSVFGKRQSFAQCINCDAKLRSSEFHAGLLELYRQLYVQHLAPDVDGPSVQTLQLFLRHLKHISHLLTNDLASGILAQIVLPIFRHNKILALTGKKGDEMLLNASSKSIINSTKYYTPNSSHLTSVQNSPTSPTSPQSPITPKSPVALNTSENPFPNSTCTPLTPQRTISPQSPKSISSPISPMHTETSVNSTRLEMHINSPSSNLQGLCNVEDKYISHLNILHTCLNIFAMYLSDIRLIKAFYNEENIKHFEDLLHEPELINGICDLIKVGIDNLTFLGDNSLEQTALSRRLITLQLQSSDRTAQLFNALLQRFSKCSKTARASFWLDPDNDQAIVESSHLKPMDILHITALQWSLNFELLKTSQFFYNEFAKIYSIVLDYDEEDRSDTDNENRGAKTEQKINEAQVRKNYLQHGDKTIIDILKLNYNALSCFLIPPRKKSTVPPAVINKLRAGVPSSEERSAFIYDWPLGSPETSTDEHKAIDCLSSSLETLFSSVAHSINTSTSTSTSSTTTAYDESCSFDKITQFYLEDDADQIFLKKLHSLPTLGVNPHYFPGELQESIVLFDIRNQIKPKTNQYGPISLESNNTNNSTSSWSLLPSDTFNCASEALTNVLADSKTQSAESGSKEGLIAKLFGIVGSFFSGGHLTSSVLSLGATKSKESQSEDESFDADLLCFYTAHGDGKKSLLKLFEATMAICVKGYQNEEVEKMQRHLRKLKAIIISSAAAHWQQHAEEHTRDNAILQVLQTLLKLAELSHTFNEPNAVSNGGGGGGAGVGVGVSGGSGDALTIADEVSAKMAPQLPPAHGRSYSSIQMRSCPSHTVSPALPARGVVAAATTVTLPANSSPCRPVSGESEDTNDFFSTRASIICPDSEFEFSENEQEDFYLTADEGYEADAEIPEATDSDAEALGTDLWNPLQPASRYRSHVVHDGLCRLVVEILMELSQMCTSKPSAWCDSLAQLANRLFVIRDYLGGPLCLLRGFAPVLTCNDPALKELQQAILELIVDLNTPDVLCTFFSILAAKNAPVDILMKYMSYICANSLKKVQPSVELEFPVNIDGKCISTSDKAATEQIDRVRTYHLHCQANTPFTRAPCIIPITHARLWSNDGLTLSLWMQVKSSQRQKSASQIIEDDARSASEDYLKSHIVSLGTNQAMLSIYVNSNMNLVFETCKPNAEIQTRTPMAENNSDSIDNLAAGKAMGAAVAADSKSTSKQTRGSLAPATNPALASSSPFRNALKQTKLVLLNSFSQMHLFHGNTDASAYFEGAYLDLKHVRLPKNTWTHLAFAVETHADYISVLIFINGLEQHTVNLPFRNLRNLIRTHSFQMLSLGDGLPLRSPNTSSCNNTESRSTLDLRALRLSVSNVLLFNRKFSDCETIFNLTAMGPDLSELVHCQVGNWKPNYGFLNVSKMPNANFGHFGIAIKLLKQSHILTYSAQQPEVVMGFHAGLETNQTTYGASYGLILYGELIQNQLPSLQTATVLCGGMSSLLYLFARVVESSSHATTQALALDLYLSVALSDSQLYADFLRNDHISLIGYVIRTDRCTKDVELLRSIVNNACSQTLISKKGDSLYVNENTIASLVYPRLLTSVLHRYSDWHRSGAEHSNVLDMLFQCVLALTREKHPHRDFNMDQLQNAGFMRELLNLCKVYIVESPNPIYLSSTAARSFVSILSVFAGSPPSPSLLDEIMKLLLLLHRPSECFITHDRSNFYFLLTAQLPVKERSLATAGFSRVAAPFRRQTERPGVAIQISPTVPSPADAEVIKRAARIERIRRLHASNSTYRRALHEFEENLENVADCSKLNKNALRLVSPVGVQNWRSKFKRRTSIAGLPHSPKRTYSPQKMRKSPVVLYPRSLGSPQATPQSINHKRVRPHLTRSVEQKKKEKRLRDTETNMPNSAGIISLQEGLFTLLKDALCLLPDNAVDEVLKHYIKVEFLLILANHTSCEVRAAIIRLLAALTKRLSAADTLAACKTFYPHHVGNQLSIHPTDAPMFEACVEWVTGVYGNLDTILHNDSLHIHHRFGLNALVAIASKATLQPTDFAERAFRVLRCIYISDPEEQQVLIEAGLLQCCVKALYNLYTKSVMLNLSAEYSILELLTTIGEKSLKSAGHIIVIWDILNMLSFYQEKQPISVVKAFRSVQAQLQLNWIYILFGQTSVPSNFKVTMLPACALSVSEMKTRLDLLIDRCTQFFTVFDESYMPSENEIKLFEVLVKFGTTSNQRCNNFIAWGLLPSRRRELRAFIVDALWAACQNDFVPSIVCDGKMIKSLLWLCLWEDMEEPIENLERLCKRLNINEKDSVSNLGHELGRIELSICTMSAKQKAMLEKTIYKFETLAVNCIESSMITTRRVAELQNAERKLIMSQMKDYDETFTYTKWLEIIRRMTHEGAPWFNKDRSENSWELDDTEGPSRVHTRLRRCHLDIDKRFFMEDYVSAAESHTTSATLTKPRITDEYTRPLDYLISSYDQQLNILLNSQILYNFPAKYLPVDGEIDGEIIITDHKLYFLATYRCKYFYVSCDISNITEIWLKRFQHQEKAFEIFLDTNKSLFFSLQNQSDWKTMRDVFCDKIVSPPDLGKLLLITQQWAEGLLTNWEYLMTLNQISGRTYNDLMQYPVFPWILSKYTGEMLDLTDGQNFRKLERPIAVQHEESEEHYILNYTYINNTMTNMGSLTLKPYHYSSHYSNSGTVLHFLVRVPPFTSYFLRYQDNNFDLPDRTFHALSTTWCLASKDSPTDVKELIPEFFCLPEMFENFERFNFGWRQNGERVEDVMLPPWCLRDPRLFTLIHRQALESELVRNNLHQWIDLIFGYKQTGEHAVEAINVFHPATYAAFIESEVIDPIERKAVETMVKTYGQMPRQLFKSQHPASKFLNYCLGDKEILQNVKGLRWGVYLGSPQLPPPTLGNIYKLPEAEHLVSFNSTNVVYALPSKSCVMQGAEVDTFNVVYWGCGDRIVRIQPLNKTTSKCKNLLHNNPFDDITACGAELNSNQLWFGHKSGRISIYKCAAIETNNRSQKPRQSYVRGLRLSYNSAFRKITTKSGGSIGGTSSGLKSDADTEGEGSSTSTSTSSLPGNDTQQRDSADLSWSGPTILLRHTDAITCIQLSMEFKIAVTAGRDGLAVIWDLNDWSYIRTIERPTEIHHSPITLIAISPTLGDIVTVHTIPQHGSDGSSGGEQQQRGQLAEEDTPIATQIAADECFEVTEENLDDFVNVSINPNGKSILRLHTVNARYIQHIVHEDRILAACYSYIKEGVGVNVIATAVEGGVVRLWSSWNLSFVREIVTGISNIKSMVFSTHQHLVTLTQESRIQVWETEGLYGSAPKFPQIAYK